LISISIVKTPTLYPVAIMQVRVQPPLSADLYPVGGSSKQVPRLGEVSLLEPFYQLQVEQLAARSALANPQESSIFWACLVYYDPLFNEHRSVSTKPPPLLSLDILAYLKTEAWLIDLPLVLNLTPISFNTFPAIGYLCPIGYRNQKPEYLLVLAHSELSATTQDDLVQSAASLLQYQELYGSYCAQTTEIQLLEHVIQRVGHQLRHPLGLIALYAEGLYAGLSNDPNQEKSLQQPLQQANVIRETVQDVLNHLTELIYCGRGSQLRVKLQDLRSVILESIQELQPALQQKKLQVQYPNTSAQLMLDAFQIKQVFKNLINNAIDYSPEGSVIEVNWRSFQGEVLIQITDQGVGIAPSDLQKIFQPFYTRRPGGTGLGLTIAKKIILDHQGQIWAQASAGTGAQFSITLPLTRSNS
jgi:signal transduction histidine kinase